MVVVAATSSDDGPVAHGDLAGLGLEATVEAHVLPAARVREACQIPGTSVHTAWLCRDKPAMKEALRTGATLGEVSDALRDVFGIAPIAHEVLPWESAGGIVVVARRSRGSTWRALRPIVLGSQCGCRWDQ